MNCLTICLAILATFFIPLSAQSSLTPSPSPFVFTASPGQFDSRSLTITNAGTTACSYSLLTNPTSLLDDQVSYYPFDNSLTDLFTNWTGAVSGTFFGSDRLNQMQYAIGFDGVNDYYETWENNLANTFSVSFRAKPQRTQAMTTEGYYNTARTADYILWPNWYATGYEEGFGIALGRNGLMVITHAASYMPVLLSYPADLSGWNHYTLVFSDRIPKLYINGVLVHTGIISPRTVTYMSYMFGGAAYGFYKGYMDDLCVYDSALSDAQILSSYQFTDMSRFRIQPRTEILTDGESDAVMVRMIDDTLTLGTHNDVITLCQMGATPIMTQVPVVINIGNLTVPLAPGDITITLDEIGNTLLEWSPVASTTHYKIYGGMDPIHPEYFTYVGSTTETTFTYAGGDRPINLHFRFFTVVAYLE